MTADAEKKPSTLTSPTNEEFERCMAELEEALDEWEASDPNPDRLPGEPRRPGILATYLTNNPIRH